MEPLNQIEKKILKALNWQHHTKFKADQFIEWSSEEIKPQEGEKVYRVTEYGMNVAIKL